MILVDTSIWIDHFRSGDAGLVALLEQGQVLAHPFVIGELALGQLAQRNEVIGLLRGLSAAVVATDDEAQHFIEQHTLYGLGIGYVDVHLLAATGLTADATLWTRDKRLRAVAMRLMLAATIVH